MFSNNKSGRSGGGRGGFKRDGDAPRRSFGSDRGDRGGSFNRKSSFGGDRDSEPRVNFKAVCDDCGNDCMVPFKPSGNKPIYCSSCFEKHGNGKDSSSFSPRGNSSSFRSGGDNSSSDLKNQLYHIEDKLDQLLELLKRK